MPSTALQPPSSDTIPAAAPTEAIAKTKAEMAGDGEIAKLEVRSTANYSGLQLERLDYKPTLSSVFDGEHAHPPG